METIDLDGQEIKLSKEENEYRLLRSKYSVLAKGFSNDFELNIYSYFKDTDDLNDRFLEFFQEKYLKKSIDEAIRFLVSYGVYDVDQGCFAEKYFKPFASDNKGIKKFTDKYLEIVLSEEDFAEYKERQKEGRGGVIGGGFGLEGAAQGMLIATGANLAISFLGGMTNAAAEGLQNLGSKMKKDSLFKDISTVRQLSQFIYKSCYDVHYAIIDALHDRLDSSPVAKLDSDTVDSAKRKFSNIKNNLIPAEIRREQLRSVIVADPYEEEYYVFWLINYGDKSQDIEKVATYFGFENIYNKKREMFLDHLESYARNNWPGKQDAIKKSLRFSEFLGYKGSETLKIYLDSYFNDLENNQLIKDESEKKSRKSDEIEKNIENLKHKLQGSPHCNEKKGLISEIDEEKNRLNKRRFLEKMPVYFLVFLFPFSFFGFYTSGHNKKERIYSTIWFFIALSPIFYLINVKGVDLTDIYALTPIIAPILFMIFVGCVLFFIAEKIGNLLCRFKFSSASYKENLNANHSGIGKRMSDWFSEFF